MTKTKFQKKKEQRHGRVVKLFLSLEGEGLQRAVTIGIISAKTGYSAPHIYAILRRSGVDYREMRKERQNEDV